MIEKNDVETQLSRALEYYRFRAGQNFEFRKLGISAWAVLCGAAFSVHKIGISGTTALLGLAVLTFFFIIIDLVQGSGLMRWDKFIRSLERLLYERNFDVEPSTIYFSSYGAQKKIYSMWEFFISSGTAKILYSFQFFAVCILLLGHSTRFY